MSGAQDVPPTPATLTSARADELLSYDPNTGVYWSAERNKWQAQIRIKGRVRSLGRFLTIEDAMTAHAQAKMSAHTFQPTQRI